MKYEIKEVKDRVFAVIIPNHYDRAMTFCRVQEFYESPNPDFRGKHFNIWDFIEWYSKEHKDAFTYAFDWGGFKKTETRVKVTMVFVQCPILGKVNGMKL
jgi:hypothetical protein